MPRTPPPRRRVNPGHSRSVTMRMDEEDIRVLRRVGTGNVSAGFRAVMQVYTALPAEVIADLRATVRQSEMVN
jgi:hypothetical protein